MGHADDRMMRDVLPMRGLTGAASGTPGLPVAGADDALL